MALGDLAKGAQTMLGFGVASRDVAPLLEAIGDISMGDSAKFQALALASSWWAPSSAWPPRAGSWGRTSCR